MATSNVLALVTDAFGGRGGIAQYNRDLLAALVDTGSVSSIKILPRHAPDRLSPMPAGIEQLPAKPGRIAYIMAALKAATSRATGIVWTSVV